MRRGMLVVLALGLLLAAGAVADPATPLRAPARAQVCGPVRCAYQELSFTTVGGSWTGRSPNHAGNVISIFRRRKGADSWADYVGLHAGHPFVRKNDFARNALVGVFLFDRGNAEAVSVQHLWLKGDTLLLALEVLLPPVYVNDTPGQECVTQGPGITMFRPHWHVGPHGFPYTLAAVSKSALDGVHRVVVVSEIDYAPELHYSSSCSAIHLESAPPTWGLPVGPP